MNIEPEYRDIIQHDDNNDNYVDNGDNAEDNGNNYDDNVYDNNNRNNNDNETIVPLHPLILKTLYGSILIELLIIMEQFGLNANIFCKLINSLIKVAFKKNTLYNGDLITKKC